MKFAFIIGLLAVLAAPARAQLQLDAGVSTLYGAPLGGAGITAYLPNKTIYAGAIYANDKIIPAAYEKFQFHGYEVIAGSQTLGYMYDGGGVSLSCVCVSTKAVAKSKKGSIALFFGAVGDGYFFPFSIGALPSHFGTGVSGQYQFTPQLSVSSLDVVSGGNKTAAQGVSYRRWNRLSMSGSTGLLNNMKFLQGGSGLRIYDLNFRANHSTYFEPYETTGNNLGVGFHHKFFTANAGWNNSYSARNGGNVGENLGAGLNFRMISAQSNWYRSRGQKILAHSITEQVATRLQLTQSVQQTNDASGRGRLSYGLGGGYQGNRVQANITHSIQFLLNGQGYQQVTSVTVSVRVRDLVINGQTLTDPFGKTRWTGSTETFVQANMPSSVARKTRGGGGKYTVAGICSEVTKRGEVPLQGCAIRIGDGKHPEMAFSDAHGRFELHVHKNKAVKIAVVVDEFSGAGEYVIVTTPTSATPGTDVRILVMPK